MQHFYRSIETRLLIQQLPIRSLQNVRLAARNHGYAASVKK